MRRSRNAGIRQTNVARNTELNNGSAPVPAEAVLVSEIPLVHVNIQPGDYTMSKPQVVTHVNAWSPQNVPPTNPYSRIEY